MHLIPLFCHCLLLSSTIFSYSDQFSYFCSSWCNARVTIPVALMCGRYLEVVSVGCCDLLLTVLALCIEAGQKLLQMQKSIDAAVISKMFVLRSRGWNKKTSDKEKNSTILVCWALLFTDRAVNTQALVRPHDLNDGNPRCSPASVGHVISCGNPPPALWSWAGDGSTGTSQQCPASVLYTLSSSPFR